MWNRFESDAWRPCCWNDETGREWVETEAGELLWLEPISRSRLPAETRVERVDDGYRITSDQTVIDC